MSYAKRFRFKPKQSTYMYRYDSGEDQLPQYKIIYLSFVCFFLKQMNVS